MDIEIDNPPNKYPTLLLARMATTDGMRCLGIGREMLKRVFAMGFRLTDQIGCRFVKVDAKNDPRTIRFYEKYGGFVEITRNSETVQMVVDLNKIGTG